jgi:NADH:ubiquinone oxidoreductase subunit F (NADH-binding)
MRRAGWDPGINPRLVVPKAVAGRLTLDDELQIGTYSGVSTADVIAELQSAQLLGRGGAGFPAHSKWASVAAQNGPTVVVANGEEGEPSSSKDRWLLDRRPHLILAGLLLASRAVSASRAIVYVSDAQAVQSIQKALAELRATDLLDGAPAIELFVVPRTYVAGEETAACRAINGGPALPTSKPPRPFESGVDGHSTLVANVETLAHAAWILRHGAGKYRQHGTEASPGTTLMTINGACIHPGVYEVPFGLTLGEVCGRLAGGFSSQPRAFVVGGWFGGVLPASSEDLPCCYSAMRLAGTGFGCGSITVLGEADDPLQFASDTAGWFSQESARQCGVCTRGTAAIAATLQTLCAGAGTDQDLDNLTRWSRTLRGRGACALLDGAANLASSVAQNFSEYTHARPHRWRHDPRFGRENK